MLTGKMADRQNGQLAKWLTCKIVNCQKGLLAKWLTGQMVKKFQGTLLLSSAGHVKAFSNLSLTVS